MNGKRMIIQLLGNPGCLIKRLKVKIMSDNETPSIRQSALQNTTIKQTGLIVAIYEDNEVMTGSLCVSIIRIREKI